MSLGTEDFIVPEEPLEQEHFKRRLIATARSLKKKQHQLQADQDLLNERWTDVLAAEEYGLERPTKSYPKHKQLPQFDDEALELVLPRFSAAGTTTWLGQSGTSSRTPARTTSPNKQKHNNPGIHS